MVEILILIVLAVLGLVVLLLPVLITRRKRRLTGKLIQYQTIAEALLEGDLPRAREALKSLIRGDTGDIAAYLRLARILHREGDLERAVALYRSLKAREIADGSLRQQVAAGLVGDLFLLGRYDEARAEVEDLKQLDRKNPLIWQVELHDALDREDWSRALKATDALARAGRGFAGPNPSQIRTYVALRRASEGQLREARKLIEDTLRDEPDYGPGLLLLGDLRTREGDQDKAVEVWKQLLRARPEAGAHVIARLEKAYYDMGRFSDLAPLYEELVGTAPDRSPALQLARVRMALRRGEPGEGLRIVGELLEREPQNHDARDWRLFLLLEAQRGEEAREALKERVEGAMARPEPLHCPRCNHPCEVVTVRCESCGAWLPDPFARGVPDGPGRPA